MGAYDGDRDSVWAVVVDGSLDRSEGDKEDRGAKKGDLEGLGDGLRVGEPTDSTEQCILVFGAHIDTLQDTRVNEASLFNSIQLNSIQFNSIQFNSIPFHSIQFNSIQFNSIQFNSIQFNSIQFNSIQFNSI